ncbi:4Fe-4S dicluster domain-containing protein [Parvibacter caecicola]|uniref:4Fe-4S dicluster domain-containing protein n=1 Tax=Parvibacter caecicola TaxID=747645 RepID=A0A3N0A7P5_9ACTN|nr:4Fe-4S dicluster domain-containing protein [Parvibacter caecicola]MBB3170988.1 ferredoxin-type protein NapG [Parvibacter caecicola]MCR2042217.1 4Fe-4S dicluster domain-containing protein [Parvibacter caecicola]RNL09115.1 4Fe-4S ferredoxin [Parvibacter caecicola]TJW11165.1 4Fe-4S dicluster domain-containing protein [Parvibacter caecicola]
MSAMTRRSFVGLAAVCAVGAGVGGLGTAFAQGDELLRPPGGQDERALRSACLKCDRCRSVCPTDAISLASVEDGLVSARTPKLDFHKGYCDFCGKCIQVCPTGALRSFDETREKLGVAVVQKDRCLSYFQGCNACEDSCAFGALSFSQGHPVIDGGLCNGCGQCEYECTALVYGTFAGGTRRGIVVLPPQAAAALGGTLVDGASE